MNVEASDPRAAEGRSLRAAARLPKTPAVGVDPHQWENLRRTQDPDLAPALRKEAAREVQAFSERQPEAFDRLNRATARHDVAAEGLFLRALWVEDALIYPAAVRAAWGARLGRAEAHPQLPRHVAAFALAQVFSPAGAGAVLAAVGLSCTPRSADLTKQRRELQKEHWRSMQFWERKAKAQNEEPKAFALDFLVLVGNIFASEVDSLDRLKARAEVLLRLRRQEL